MWGASSDIPTGGDVEFNLVKFLSLEIFFDLNDGVHSLDINVFNFSKGDVGAAINNLLDGKLSINKSLSV